MSDSKSVAETAATYLTVPIDDQRPLVLERDGKPVAVILDYDIYTRLLASAVAEEERQGAAWSALQARLAAIHARPTDFTPDAIEAEITAARQELKAPQPPAPPASAPGMQAPLPGVPA